MLTSRLFLVLVLVLVLVILVIRRGESIFGVLERVVFGALGPAERHRRRPPGLGEPVGLALPRLHLALALFGHCHEHVCMPRRSRPAELLRLAEPQLGPA